MEKTLTDVMAKSNKNLSFEERAKKFHEKLEPICKELGIMPWAQLIYTEEGINASPVLRDIWPISGKE